MKKSFVLFSLFLLLFTFIVSSAQDEEPFENPTYNDFEEHTPEMIRLNGSASAIINGHFIVIFEDGFTGRFSHLYGVGLHAGEKIAACAFDNFTIRRQ